MIVYRDQRRRADPRHVLAELRADLERLDFRNPASHDDVVDAFMAGGMLESAVADELFPTADDLDPLARGLGRATLALGHVLWHSWRGEPTESERWRARAVALLHGLELHQLPHSIELSTPEGYAYYAVYPESYLEAARRCYATVHPSNVVCIGLRSIGASLSAAVASAFEELGCRVHAFTLRPRGHPFSRRPVLSHRLEQLLAEEREAHFLVIDEGPGISGSSLGGTAELLAQTGIEDTRIILFPSHQPERAQLRSPEARKRWGRHRQFTVSFEELWIKCGKLSRALPGYHWQDVSAGAWRRKLYDDEAKYPATQPHHERRKYLLQSDSDEHASLLSFFGLGRGIRSKLTRAERLAQAGFTPAPERVVHGFVLRDFVAGWPLAPGEVDQNLLETVARYLDHLYREHTAEASVSDDSLREMIRVNVAEGLGPAWAARAETALPGQLESWSERPIALDGRMQAHEWIRTDHGYVKVDAFDHHNDHFFPGCQDIAWDITGVTFELALAPEATGFLVERYRSLSGDRTISSRLSYYALAYLAFRLGYSRLAASVLAEDADGLRFSAAAGGYAGLLRRELSGNPGTRWNV